MDSTTTLQEIHLALIVSNNFSLCFQCSDQTAALIAALPHFLGNCCTTLAQGVTRVQRRRKNLLQNIHNKRTFPYNWLWHLKKTPNQLS